MSSVKKNAGDLIHPELPLDELRPTRGSQAAAVSSLMQMIAIICAGLGDEDALDELELVYGGDGETEWWRNKVHKRRHF